MFFRKNDFENDAKKTLSKDSSLFDPMLPSTAHPQFGGLSSDGPHIKKSTKAEKVYYLSPHQFNEYYACEIFTALGLVVPKIRTVTGKQTKIASKSLDGFIPMSQIRSDVPRNYKILRQYELDFKNQTLSQVYDKSKQYRISGNLFATHIASLLVADADLQPKNNNLGVIKLGNRFFGASIDKDKSSFLGWNYQQLYKYVEEELMEDELFQACTLDQELVIIHKIQQSLAVGDKKSCTFDKIFLSERVKATDYLSEKCEEKLINFKKSAMSMLAHYQKKHGETYLELFLAREKIREKIVDAVLHAFDMDLHSFMKIKNIIVEDLRAPYYKIYFHDKNAISHDDLTNSILKEVIIEDIRKEFGFNPKHSLGLSK